MQVTQHYFLVTRALLYLCCLGLLTGMLFLLPPALGTRVSAAGPAVLVKDIYPGPEDGLGRHNMLPWATARGLLFFTADDGVHGEELWISDGTVNGTRLLADIRAQGYSSILFLTNVNDTIFFGADDGVHGYELWKSDGTPAGTTMVADIFPGERASFPEFLTNANGTLFFRALDPVGWGLWKSNGTPSGTVLVKRHSQPINAVTNVNGTVFYISDEGLPGSANGLWRSDGTEAGTTLLKTFSPAQAGGSLSNLTAVNNRIFFVGYTAGRGYELWKSDGSVAGTAPVSDAGPTMAFGNIWFLQNVSGTLFILTDQSQQSTALWRSDGTAAGTVQLKQFDLFTSAADVTPINTMANVNGTLVFAIYPAGSAPGTRNGAIWRSDGTTAGTVPINEQLYHGLPSAVACGKLYFTARSTDATASPQDLELWQSDGTAAGTTQVQDIAPGEAGSEPRTLTAVGRQLFFSADDGTSGRELWVLPIERTSLPGPTPSIPLPHRLFLPHTQADGGC